MSSISFKRPFLAFSWSIKNLYLRTKDLICENQTNTNIPSGCIKVALTKSLKGRICSSFVNSTWLAMLWSIWKEKKHCRIQILLYVIILQWGPVLWYSLNKHLILPVRQNTSPQMMEMEVMYNMYEHDITHLRHEFEATLDARWRFLV